MTDRTTKLKQIHFAILLKAWMDLRHCDTQKLSELSGLPARLIEVYAHSEADPPFTSRAARCHSPGPLPSSGDPRALKASK